MANGASRLNVSMLFLWFLLLFNDLAKAVRAGNCPDFPRQQNCPDSTIDQCKYDEDCKENNQQKCCKIGCRRICFDPSNLALVSGNSMCPALPRPAPCPNQPNQCINKKDCSTGQECCSDGCRMICVQPLLAPLKTLPTTKVVNTIEGRTCNTIVDLAFIIDSSGSISRRNYVKIKNFVKYLARSFKISPTGSRAAVVLYSTSASVKAHFGKYTTIEEFNDMVERLPHERGFTYIDKALELAASQLFPRARKDVPRIAMLLTDGEQTDPNGTVNLRVASAPLRRQGVRLIAFGVGKRINVRELRLAVERDEDVVRVMKFDDLNDKVRNYTKSLCEAAETEPIHPDADIIFLVDTSVGVSSEQFDLQKQFLRRMARYFLISPLGPRAAFATYGSLAYTVIGFSGYSSDADFSLKINSARFLGGTRRIDKALDHAAKMFRDTGRVGLRIVILLTAGNYYTGPGASSVSSAMMPLRNLDAHLYVIGIGSQFSPLMFKQMVREPKDIFQLPSFNELTNWQSLIARQLRSTSNAFKYEPAYFHSDVIFLMDSSSYVGANNYILEKNFVKLMARLLNLANNRTRAALYTFSDRPQLEITFDGYEDRAAFESAVNNAPHLQGSRRIDRAFESAAQLLRTKSRDSVPKYVVLLTSGRQTRTADTRTLEVSSQQVRFYGGRVFVIAILTGGYSIRDFYPAVQRPNDAFPITSFVDLLPRAPAFASRMMGSWRAPNVPSFAADIAFILDSSSLVTPFQYSRAKRFVRILSEYLNVSPGKSRGSFVTYGESPVVVFNFDGYNSHSEFRNKVTNAPYLGGEPSISSALRAAGTLFSDARGLHPWVTILVTPWRPKDIRDTRSLEAAARPLLNRGIWLYVLSIGENPYVGWLRPMIVEPRDAFSVVSYRDLPASIGPVARYITGDNYLFGHSGFQLDILFLMDTSSGVDLNDYKIQKGFVQRIALHLGVFNGKSRAALVAYGANASVVFSFGGYSSDSEFLTRVNDAPIIGGERRVYSALDTSAALLLEARSVMPKAIFLLIAGRQSSDVDSIPIKDAARPLHQLGAWVYVMAIGPTDVSELQKATIRPTDLFFARSFSGLYGFIAPVAGYVANTSVITGISTLNADIVFVIDCSSDVPFREYGTEKAFVRSLIKYLNVQPGQSRVALVTYGSRAMPVVRFESSRTIVRFFSDLTKAPYLGGGRRVDIALGIAMRIFATARENVPKVVLLFMAGKQSRVTGAISLRDSVRQIHQQGVLSFIFRIGSQPEITELYSAVNRPENVISFSNFAAMDARVPYVARHIPFYSAILGPLSLAVDVVYLLDSSNSVTQQHYTDQKTFIKQLSRYLNTMPFRTRGAVITYGSTATVITKFGDTSTTDEFHSVINNAPKVGGPRRMDRAIDTARNSFARARPAVPKVVILLTTGNQPAGIQAGVLDTSFQRLYDLGARLYAVTISSEFIILPLRGSAGSDWFPVRSFISLPVYVVPLARHVSYDTAALGPYDFDADVIFMLDSSSRVTPQDFTKEKEFVKLIARYLNIAPGKSRGSVIVFSTNANPLLSFDGYSSMSEFNIVIDRAPQLSGKRRIDRAFGAAATLFQNARPSVRKIAILLTGGRQSPDGGSLEDALQLMRNRDVTTYVISIGDRSDVPVQRPEDLFYLASYSDLPRQVQAIAKNITKPIARVTTPAPTTPSPTTPTDPCTTEGCNAPYNIGCRAVNNKAQCICPTCPNILKPVCTSDHVQDLSECHMKRQACELKIDVEVEKRGPCDKECRSVMDIAFIIDSSGSIGKSNWERMKRFLKALVSKLDVSDSVTHIAAVAYSDNPEVVMRFNNFQGVDQVNRLFDEMRWQRGFTYTDKALLLADTDLFQTSNGMRTDVAKLAFVITDGKQTTKENYTRLSEASQGIKNKGVTVYALGVGNGVDRAELEEIASSSDYVSTASSFEDLLVISSGIRQLFCAVPTQATKVTTPSDPCVTDGCRAPYNTGCRVVNKTAQCICPTCPNVRRTVCASDDVQDLSECHLKQQACGMDIAVTVAKQAPCDKECSTVVDIAFVVDSSGSIGRSNWERVKRFLKALVSKLDVSPSATHLAVISYSTNPKVELRFNGLQDTDEVNRKLDDMIWQRGLTYTDKALQLANRDLFQVSNGMRSSVPKLALVITDGRQTTKSSYTRLSVASQGMKNKGVIVYAVGVGAGADRAEMAEIASGSNYVYTSNSFKDLQNIAPTIRKRLCQPPTQAPQVTTPRKPDLCEIRGCSAPYNIGCRVVDSRPQCICPTCPNIRRPVCASDDVQDLSECHLKQQACLGNISVTVVKQAQCDKECRPVLDIAFIVDSSGSIGRSNWERVKRFVKALISKLDVSSSGTRVAAISYSTNPEVVTRFISYQGTDHVNRLIDRMRYQRGFTYTDRALLLADRDLFQRSNGMRSNVPKLAFVITDGKQTTTQAYTRLSEASRGMKNKGVIVYAVGVGRGVNTTELEEFASGSKYVYTSASFRDLQNIAPEIRKRLCGALPTRTTTVTPAPTTPDPCVAPGCNSPYNIGCRVVDNKAQCVCPTCPNTLRPVCASDDVQDLSECHLKRQACQGNINVTISKQGPCDKECRTVVDIAFIIDSSGSIGLTNWERMKRFLKALVSKLDVSPSATQIAAVSYSTNPEVVLRFSGFQGTVQVNQLLDRMRFQRGFTYTDKALLLADRILFQTSTGMRLRVPKLAIVITDGKQKTTLPYTRLSEASRGMKNKGVTVYAIGVGSGADRAELEEIASGPSYILTSSSFSDLQSIAPRITKRLCAVPTKTTTSAPTPTTTAPTPTTTDLCLTQGCRAPYNIGCQVVDNKVQCICPTCSNIPRPVCATDGVQDLSECHMRRQACQGDIAVAVAKQGPCDKECRTVVDIAFVIDSSGSIGRTNWEKMKRFLKALVSRLDVSPSATHIAAIAYSNNPEVVMRFNGVQGTTQVNQLLDGMRYQRGFTYIDKALVLADRELFQSSTGMRSNVPKLALVITDGKQTTTRPYTRLSVASLGIKNKGVTVYALGVGSGADRAELEEIASGPSYVLISSSFSDLQSIAPRITRRFCTVPTQTTTSAPTPTTTAPTPTTTDLCLTQGCRAPYNIGCQVVDNKVQCICPTCSNIPRPVCATDGVQDLSECHMRRQACQGDIAVAVAKQGPCDKECRTVVDIAFVIDSSGSIGRTNWEKMKRFLKALVSRLDVSPSATHIAAIAYSNNPEVVMRFNGVQGTTQVNQLLDGMRYQRGFTYIDKALVLADRELFQSSTGMRSNVPKLALVITDGKQTTTRPYTRLSVASLGIKNKGVTVYALGVGSGADRAELEEIASGPSYVLISSSFSDLQSIAPRITRRFCTVPTQTTTSAPTPTTTAPTPTTTDLCLTQGCRAPYNIGCQVVDNKVQCICPTCSNIPRPVCATDGVQDLSECHMRRQACQGDIAVAVAKQGPCDKECRTVVDIAFVIDSSGSIGRTNWEKMKRFLKALVSRLDVSPSATHIAAIAYSNNPEVVMRFNGVQGTTQVNQLLDGMRYQRGFTYIDKALVLADRELFQSSTGMRSNVPKLALVITDGKQTTTRPYTRLSVASLGIKNKGVTVYALGVGSGADRAELEEIASGPSYVLISSSFSDLQSIAPRITRRFCTVPTQTTTSAPTPTTTAPTPTTTDLCLTQGCRAPYNIGCQVVDNKVQCICPTCSNIPRPVCATDGVQDLSECHMRRQACQGDIAVAVSKQGPCDKECRTVVDIAFVIDSSGSIGRTNWEKMKRFLKALVSRLDVSPSATHIAAIAYSNNPEVVMRFNGVQGTTQVNQLLDGMRYQRGFTYIDKALVLADRELFQSSTGMRSNVPKLALVITDGKQTTARPYTRLSVASLGLKNKGVTVYALGVGSGADRAELEEIASGSSYVLTSSSFTGLQSIAPRITKRFCAVPTQTTTSAPTPTTTAPTPTTTDLCLTQGCRAPYNIGCQVVDNKVQCICPTCSNIPRPVCATDGVQDLSECHMRRQACQGDIAVAVSKQGPCDKECRTVVDIAFVIDSSGSIGRTNWEKMKRFLKALVSRLDVSPSATHIAAIAYSNNPEVVMRFNGVQGTTQVNQLLDGMRYQRGFTYIDKALVLADRELFQSSTGMRPNVPKLALVITDGKQTTTRPYTRLSVASLGIKNKGVTVYALGVGSGADRAELEEIASGPSYVLTSSSFSNLQSIAPRITQRFCADSTPTTKATSTPAPATTPVTPDPCETQGCRAPYNVGCRVVGNKAQCICPTCPNITRPVCGSDDVQDLSECHLRRQACQGDMIVFTTKRSPCDKDCRPLLDIAFIIDSSGSIGRTNWERMKRFLKALVSKLDVSPSATHVAAVAYSNNPVVVMRFTGAQDTNEVNRLFDGMPWQRGFTYTDKALQLADRDLFQTSNGMRPNVAKIAIVITDGKQTKTGVYTSLVVASGGIKNKGVTVYAIGVGNEVDRNELEEIASDSQYVFTTSSFRALRTIAPLIRTGICEDPETKYSANVIFVMDSSSETASIYNTEKDVIKSLARYLKVHPQGTRAALIAFDGRPVVISDFESFRSASDFESVVDKVPHYGGSRSVSGALRTAAGMFPNSPSSVSKVVFLVTSGQPLQNKDKNSVGNVLNKLYAMGVRSYVTLIGPSPSIPDFRSSLENPENVFTIPSRSDIPEQINQIGSQVLTDSVRPYELNLTMYVLFVIDSSAEVTPSNFRQGKEFIKSVISQLNIYPGDSSSRVGIMVYSDGPTMVLDFKNEESKSSLETIIDNLPHLRGARRIDRALKAATDVLRDIDTDHPKFVILVAAGRQTDEPGSQTFSAAVKPLQRTGTKIHVMAVGDNVDPSYFQEEDKNKSSVISVPSFLELPQGAERLSTDILVEYVAPREPKTATPSPTTVEETTPTELPSTTEPRGTNTVPAKVHGGWGPWGGWSKCTKTCGSGTQTQERRCDSPTPENGGRPCNGPRQQSRVCNTRRCPVHGGWGPWGRWSKCTKTCGSGRQTQERRCDNPRPENGGRPCNGPTQQSRVCNTRNCPEAPPSSVDIVFLLDTSNGVNQNDLRQQKDFAKLVAKQIGVAPNSSHAAVFSYSDKPILIGGFFDYLVGKSFEDIVDSVTLTGGKRNIQEALQSTQRLLTSARPDVPRVVFLITYGQQARELGSQRLREMARSVREMRAVLYIIGVGVDDNDPQLQPVVERRSDFFEIPSSDDLNSYVQPIAYYVVSSTDAIAPKDYKAEVIYVVDSSSFVGLDNYRTEKDFVKSLARVLNHGPSHTQSSVIIFDSFLETPIRMGSYREIGSFSEAVNNLRYLGGSSSRLDFALAFAARGFSTNRPDVPKIIIVITNRDPPSRGPIDALADIIRQEGKAVYVIAVGKEADFPNLQRLVVRPEDMYTPKAFADMMSYVPSIASNILALTVPSTTAAATTTELTTTVMTDVTTTPEAVTIPETIATATTPSLPTTTLLPKTTPKKPGVCPTKYTTPCPSNHLCEHDRQCPADEKCCKHSCGFLACTKMVQPNKPGSCPYLPRPSSCSSRPKECNYDIDCSGDLKCCNNGCGKICVSTDHTPTPDPFKGRCPSYAPNQKCPSSVQDECTCDSNCDVDDGYKCCFDGCRRLCRKKAEPSCVQGVDVAFLMDSSESITDEDFEREKNAVKEIARKFLKASQKSRAGVIMYSGRPELSIDFRSQSSLDTFESGVEALTHKRSKTRIDLALRYTADSLFLNPRRSVISIAVVMTDGVQTPEPNVEPLGEAVVPLRSKGVRVLAVGVGPRVNRSELEELVTSQEDVFKMSSFQELLDKSDKLLEAVCPQPPGPIGTTPREAITTSTTLTEAATTTAPPIPTTTTTSFVSTTTPSEPDPKCDKLLDIVFVMDSSRSIDAPQYEQEKNFVKKLATIFNVGTGSRAAVIIYSDDTQLKITFDQYNNLDNFLLAVDELPYLQKRTRIDKALTMASRVIQQARPGFPKVVIVMTDGRQTRDPDAVDLDVAADPIHRQSARVLVVGVGPKISQYELRLIAKDSSYVFTVQSFENLKKATRDVALSACVNPRISTTVSPIGQCPEISDSPGGSCFTYNHTCLSDEQCSSGFLCCFDGCRLTCLPSVGGITRPQATTSPPTGPTCAEAFDLGIAMDSSGSIRDANYQKQRNFIKGLASKLTVGPQNVQLGLIVFSDVPIMSIRFGTLRSTDLFSFTSAVDGVPYFRGRTRIDSALETAANSLFPEGRQSLAPQVLLLITDGRQSNDPGSIKLVDAVRPLRDQSIKVIVVGIGDDVDKDELRSIVQDPVDDLFLVASFEDLARLLDDQRLTEAFCFPTRGRFQRNRS